MTNNLWRNHILPFTLLVGLLGVATLVGDYLLHRFNLVWIGRYLGIPGTLLIIGSLIYSLRKRKMITSGNMNSRTMSVLPLRPSSDRTEFNL